MINRNRNTALLLEAVTFLRVRRLETLIRLLIILAIVVPLTVVVCIARALWDERVSLAAACVLSGALWVTSAALARLLHVR